MTLDKWKDLHPAPASHIPHSPGFEGGADHTGSLLCEHNAVRSRCKICQAADAAEKEEKQREMAEAQAIAAEEALAAAEREAFAARIAAAEQAAADAAAKAAGLPTSSELAAAAVEAAAVEAERARRKIPEGVLNQLMWATSRLCSCTKRALRQPVFILELETARAEERVSKEYMRELVLQVGVEEMTALASEAYKLLLREAALAATGQVVDHVLGVVVETIKAHAEKQSALIVHFLLDNTYREWRLVNTRRMEAEALAEEREWEERAEKRLREEEDRQISAAVYSLQPVDTEEEMYQVHDDKHQVEITVTPRRKPEKKRYGGVEWAAQPMATQWVNYYTETQVSNGEAENIRRCLNQLQEHNAAHVRQSAVRMLAALVRKGHEGMTKIFVELILDQDKDVRRLALDAMCAGVEAGHEVSVTAGVLLIDKADASQRLAGIRVLEAEALKRGEFNILQPLVWLVDDRTPAVMLAAVRLLARCVEEGARSRLAIRDLQVAQRETPASGLKWRNVGKIRPSVGEELMNPRLDEALQSKLEFDEKEWQLFGISEVRMGHFIASGGSFFQPAETEDAETNTPSKSQFQPTAAFEEDEPEPTILEKKVDWKKGYELGIMRLVPLMLELRGPVASRPSTQAGSRPGTQGTSASKSAGTEACSNDDVRAQVARALYEVIRAGDERVMNLVRPHLKIKEKKLLDKLACTTLAALAGHLAHMDVHKRCRMPTHDELEDDDIAIKDAAAKQKVIAKDALDLLKTIHSFVGSPDVSIRKASLVSLSPLVTQKWPPTLHCYQEALQDVNDDIRIYASKQLKKLGSELPDDLLPDFLERLKNDASLVVQLTAVETLSCFATRNLVANDLILVTCDQQQNTCIRTQAVEALLAAKTPVDLKGVRHILNTFRQRQPFRDLLVRLIAESIIREEGGLGGWEAMDSPAKRKKLRGSSGGVDVVDIVGAVTENEGFAQHSLPEDAAPPSTVPSSRGSYLSRGIAFVQSCVSSRGGTRGSQSLEEEAERRSSHGGDRYRLQTGGAEVLSVSSAPNSRPPTGQHTAGGMSTRTGPSESGSRSVAGESSTLSVSQASMRPAPLHTKDVSLYGTRVATPAEETNGQGEGRQEELPRWPRASQHLPLPPRRNAGHAPVYPAAVVGAALATFTDGGCREEDAAAVQEESEEEDGPPTVLSTVVKSLKDHSSSVRLAVLQILVKAECPVGLRPFCKALADVDANVQVAASAALQQAVARGHGQLVVEQLLRRALHDASTDVRESCMLCLMQPNFISEPRVVECMCSLAPGGSRSAEPSLRRLAVLGLGRVGELWAAVAGIDDTDVTVRTASAHVACEARGIVVSTQGLRPKTIPPVLSQETENQIEGILFKALQDWDPDLRALAAKALATVERDTEGQGYAQKYGAEIVERIEKELVRIQVS